MTNDPTLFDPPTDPKPEPEPVPAAPRMDRRAAIAAGVAGADQAEAHADPVWIAEADAAIARTARAHESFDADDVWEFGELRRVVENRALGPRLAAAARAGLIVATGDYRRSRQVQCHGMPRRVWKSLVCEAE